MTTHVELLPVERETSGPFSGIATLRLEQVGKPVVVLDQHLIQRLEATIKALGHHVMGLVLASASDRAFIAGADLKTISEWPDDQLHKYLEQGAHVFGMLPRLPYPTVAAINGAALGGGLELAMHCDGLVAAPPPEKDGQPGKPYAVGLPEAGLSLCPGWGGSNLLAARMDPAEAIRRTATGKPLTFDEAREAGMFDRVAHRAGDLMQAAKEWVWERAQGPRVERDGKPSRWIGRPKFAAQALAALDKVRGEALAGEPASAVLDAVNTGLINGWDAAIAAERRHLVRLRGLPAAKAALESFFARSGGAKR